MRLVAQRCTAVSVEFDDTAVADHFDQCVDEGRAPEQFARIWIHTHPGDCALPSSTDEDTFARCFGQADWAVMFILADGGATYARLQFNVGPTVSVRLHVEVEFEPEFAAAEPDVWDAEYEDCVSARDPFAMVASSWPAASRRTNVRPGTGSGDGNARVEESVDGQSALACELTGELQAEQEVPEFDRYCSAGLGEQDIDDWYERWMADAVFDPEVPDLQSDDCFAGKEDSWKHHMSAATG